MAQNPVVRSTTSVLEKCRCGVRIPPGGGIFRVATVLPSHPLFDGHAFCSTRCIHAYCLESLETLDAIDTPAATAMVSDLHALHQELAELLASIRV
jgi:hypothetical protein